MSELVKRLRFCRDFHGMVGYPENSKLFGEAAECIASRDAEVAELRALVENSAGAIMRQVETIAALKAEVERLREALGRVRDETLNGKSDGIVDRIYAIVSGAHVPRRPHREGY
jgi:hypothetical protein